MPQMSWRHVLPRSFGWIALGVALGLGILLCLRVAFYEAAGLTPNMAPQIAYLFSPFILVFLLPIVFVAEVLLQRWWSRPNSRAEALLFGVAHVSLLLFWAFPGFVWAMLVLNPLTLRWFVGSAFRARAHAA